MSKPETHNEISQALREAIGQSRSYIVDVWPDYVVYCVYQEDGPSQHWKAEYKFDDDGRAELGNPEKVEARTVYEPVAFSINFSQDREEGDDVIYTGKVGEIGFFPDKRWGISEAEADAVLGENFSQVENNIEHKNTVLDGKLEDGRPKLGLLRKAIRKGKDILGELAIPKISANLLGKELPCSLTFDPVSKKITHNAFVTNPRITDALVVAFSADHAGQGSETAGDNALGQSGPNNTADHAEPIGGQTMGDQPNPASGAVADPRDAEIAALKAEKVARDKADAERDQQTVAREAKNFSASLLKDRKITTGQQPALEIMFSTAVRADHAEGIHFSKDGDIVEGENLKALKDFIANAPEPQILKDSGIGFSALATETGTPEGGSIPISPGVLRNETAGQGVKN